MTLGGPKIRVPELLNLKLRSLTYCTCGLASYAISLCFWFLTEEGPFDPGHYEIEVRTFLERHDAMTTLLV